MDNSYRNTSQYNAVHYNTITNYNLSNKHIVKLKIIIYNHPQSRICGRSVVLDYIRLLRCDDINPSYVEFRFKLFKIKIKFYFLFTMSTIFFFLL